MSWKEFRDNGLVHAPIWVLERYCVQLESQAYDLREAFDIKLFPDETKEPNDAMFQEYWKNLGITYNFCSEWEKDNIQGHCGILYNTGRMIEFYFEEKREGFQNVVESIKSKMDPFGEAEVEFGIVTPLCERGTLGSRPGLSLMVSGPHGGSEALRVFYQAFEDLGIQGLLGRTIKNNRLGIIQIVFCPEWYLHLEKNCFGVDWDRWQKVKGSDLETHFYDAMFYWADVLMKAIRQLLSEASVFINRISMDSFQTIAFSKCPSKKVLSKLEKYSTKGFPRALDTFRLDS